MSKKQHAVVWGALLISASFFCASLVYAHDFGSSFELQTNNGFIDIGYSLEEFTLGSSVIFDFELYTEQEGPEIPFTDIWVRIVRENATVFATGVHNARLGGALMTYRFPEVGEYELAVRFQNNGESVTDAVFPLTVSRGSTDSAGTDRIVFMALGLIIGLVLGALPLLLVRRNTHEV